MISKRKQVPLLLLFLISSFVSFSQADTSHPKSGDDTLNISKWLPQQGPVYHLLFQTRSRKLNTGSVGEIYNNDLEKTASASFGGTFIGRMAGLYATQASGEPGNDDVSLLVRG